MRQLKFRTFILSFLVYQSISLYANLLYSQWVVVSNQGNEAVSFPSNNIGYSTANGITKKTTNGGLNWSTLSGGNLTGIFFINDNTGWVVGYPGYIGRTTSGGSFTQQTTGVSDRLNDVFFINNDTGWVVGGDFGTERIFKTTNAGDNWTVQTSGTPNKLFSVYFVNPNTGWSVGGPSAPKIIKTTDGGSTWLTQTTSASTPLYSVRFADANTGWAVAGYIGGETIIKTTNGGSIWFSQSSGDNRYLRACAVINPNIAFAVGQSGKMITTTNGGANWLVQSTGSSIELWSIDFVNDTVGYAIGDNVVLKTTNQGLTFVSESNSEIPDRFVLHQNYPNPFNPTTTIEFEIPAKREMQKVKLVVYDILGNAISILFNGSAIAGNYHVTWYTLNFPSGIYYYSLSEDNVILDAKKMILVK